MASAACMNKDGVPVLLSVATIFWAIIALLPIPLITSLPLHSLIDLIMLKKSSVRFSCSSFIAFGFLKDST